MSTDRERAVRGLVNTIAMTPTISDANEAIKAMQRRTVRIYKLAADPAAGDNMANGVANGTFAVQASVFRKSKLVAARWIAAANVAQHGSNHATINITKDNGAGGSQTVILSANTNTTANGGFGAVVGQYTNLTTKIVAAAAVIDAGSLLQLQITKAASGVAVTVCAIELDLEEV